LRKIAALILLGIFIFSLEGAYLLFIYRQNANSIEIKTRILNNLNDDELTLIVIPNRELHRIQWVNKNSEFVYENQMYDIVRTKSEAGQTRFYCIYDKTEQKLIDEFQKSSDKTDQARKLLQKVLNTNFIGTSYSFKLPLPEDLFHYITDISSFSSTDMDIISPPPKEIHSA
jgi:hypothetical protein